MSDETLKKYHSKRNFEKTPEPYGSKKTTKEPIFVVQKHNASHLHYDFRLEHNGVLLSWAVPKGFPEDTSVKRLAVRTEDHPLAYATFSGTIPAGNYGAGTVEIWDHGTFTYTGAKGMDAGLKDGELVFDLHGKKLKGGYALIRLKHPRGNPKNEEWLLLKTKEHS